MAKEVGLSRNIKLQWLNKTVELLSENHEENEFKDLLNEYLSFEIKSPTNIRKTREILMRIWFYENDELETIRTIAAELIRKDVDNAVPAHWAVMLVAYPVFGDICRLIGRMSEFQDEITLAQIKRRLFDEWGERTTLYHSTDKIIATMKELGVLNAQKPGRYTINKSSVRDNQTVALLLRAAMQTDGKSYYSFNELNDLMVLFPFDYDVDKGMLAQDEGFDISTFGGEVAISLV